MMLVASLNMLMRRWENQPAGWLTWCALALAPIVREKSLLAGSWISWSLWS
jgi:hypothetical protein